MAVNGKAWAHGSATHPTRVLRNMLSAIMGQPMISHANSATATTRGGSYGVVGGGDLLVTTTGGLGYSVAAGRLVGPGTFATAQGAYAGYNDAAVTGSFGARDAVNPRIDYVAYKVQDTDEDATGAEADSIVVIAGTAAGSPVPPTITSALGTLVVLSEVLVPSTANGGALQFTDRRKFAAALGGVIRCTSSTRPTGGALWAGQPIFETDTNDAYIYDGTNWSGVVDTWQTYTPTWTASIVATSLGNGTLVGHYALLGKTCHLSIYLAAGSTTTGGNGNWSFSLPPGVTSVSSIEQLGDAKLFDPVTAGNWNGYSIIAGSATTIAPFWASTTTSNVHFQGRNADVTNNPGTGIPNAGAYYPLSSGGNIVLTCSFRTA